MTPGTMQWTVGRETLRHVVSTAIFCPSCDRIMDVSAAVNVDILKDGALAKTIVACAPCWDARKDAVAKILANQNVTLEVLDGRELFAKAKATRGTRKAKA